MSINAFLGSLHVNFALYRLSPRQRVFFSPRTDGDSPAIYRRRGRTTRDAGLAGPTAAAASRGGPPGPLFLLPGLLPEVALFINAVWCAGD